MNNFPNVLNIAKAVKHRSTFPLDFQHLTTMDFGKTTILHAMEVVPNDVIDIDLSCVTQLAPLVVPTMGEVNLYVRAFFVPYRFVWKDWENFFAQFATKAGTTTALNKVPLIDFGIIWEMFEDSVGTTADLIEIVESTDAHDFEVFGETTDPAVYYRLTTLGRLFQQILIGLGYLVAPAIDDTSSSKEFSCLPILSLVKVFRDYYVNPNYDYTTIDNILINGFGDSINSSTLRTLLEFVAYGWFEGDIFTQAWANPEQVGYSTVYKPQLIPVQIDSTGVINNVRGPQTADDYYLNSNIQPTGLSTISERGLHVLKQIYNFSLRQAAAGARYVDQLLSRFGIKLNENESKRSHFIGSCVFDTSISRVDATAAGTNTDSGHVSSLGDFSGRGIMNGNGHFHYENKHNDFGMIIFVAHIMPRTNYYQGFKPHVNHINFNDFFNPDLEDIGNAPIRQNEVYFDFKTDRDVKNVGAYLNGVFGFAPNYYDYKSQTSYLSGDFRCRSLSDQLKSFQLFRTLRAPNETDYFAGDSYSYPVLNEQFQKFTPQNSSDWLRMFLNQNEDADHFICSFVFKVRATRDMNSLGNSLLAELNEHGADVGNIIKVRPNGKYF